VNRKALRVKTVDAEVARATVLLHHAVVVLHKDREAIVRVAVKEVLRVRHPIDSMSVAATDPTTEAWIGTPIETWTGVAIMAHVAMSYHVTLTRS
jgi:cytochrome P450